MPDIATHVALLVIDVQQAFDEWELEGQHRNNPEAVARIVDLLQAFRAGMLHIVHVRHASTNSQSRFHPSKSGYLVKEEAREREGESVIIKGVNSSFIGTKLEEFLRTSGIDRLVICGATTNHCVETTARMAGNLGFDTYLVRDATWTFDRTGPDGKRHRAEDIHAMTLANLHGEFATIVSADEVIKAIADA